MYSVYSSICIFLGPLSDKSDLCETCYKTLTNCPGHFGYIELPLPVVNPLFHKLIGTILKMSCLSCHQIQLPSKQWIPFILQKCLNSLKISAYIKKVLTIQIKLLNKGLIIPAMDVQNIMMELVSKFGSYENIPEESISPIVEYENMARNGKCYFFFSLSFFKLYLVICDSRC